MNKRAMGLAVLLAAVLSLGGCGSTGGLRSDEATVEDRGTAAMRGEEGEDGASTRGVSRYGSFTGRELDDPNSPLSKRVVYFDFDSSTVRPEDHDVLRAHAEYLAATPGLKLALQGHADERGSREYNLALGERRATAVQRLMILLGSDAVQLSSMSYGEEKPVAYGHDEGSWSLNRRVELVY